MPQEIKKAEALKALLEGKSYQTLAQKAGMSVSRLKTIVTQYFAEICPELMPNITMLSDGKTPDVNAMRELKDYIINSITIMEGL